MDARSPWRRQAWLLLIGVGIGLGVCLWPTAGSWAEEAAKSSGSVLGGPKQTGSRASDNPDALKALKAQLDEVLATQQTILQRFDQVMEELRIIKVRATLHS